MAKTERRRRRAQATPSKVLPPVVPAGLSGGQYQPLTTDQIDRIIAAAYVVLAETGIEVEDSPCREVFRAAGCRIDSDKNRVFIPAHLIDEARKVAKPEVLLAGRDPKHDMTLSQNRVYMGTGGQAVKMLDLDGQVRETRMTDNYHIGRLCDTLEHIHFYMRPVVPRDLANKDLDVNQLYACLAATKKHVMVNLYEPQNGAKIRAMADMIAGGAEAFDARPFISCSNCWTVSPLRYATETVEILDQLIEYNIPTALSSAPQAGATSPASLAGTLVQIVAEQFSGFTYVNLKKPGFPLLFGCVPAQADLRTGAFTGGSAEFALLHAACAQISTYLNLPIYNSSGISDSKIPDAQAGFEKGLTTATAALAGSNYIHHSAGFLESLLTVAYEQYVIDNDVNGAVMRLVRGIEVTDESLAVEVIHDVCTNGPNHFLGHTQTLELMNSEYLYPELFNRQTRDDWEQAGAQDTRERARDHARQVLSSHFPEIIPESLDQELRQQFDILLPKSEMRSDSVTSLSLAS
ncbi:trimethylamine methyltransferase family protein [Rhodovibrionaceae bacterium A322]